MRKTLFCAALSIAALAIAPAAYAQSYEEQLAQLTERFKSADKNGDGKLTQKEAEDGGMTRLARYFSYVDTDGDGFVSFDQLKARLDAQSK
ncbi:MAG: EF-hand domain-containing protein [Pseudomonadota bacterium]